MPDEKTISLPKFGRAAQVRAASYDEADNSVEVIWSTGATVARRNWMTGKRYNETLELRQGAVRLDRLNAGAPLLDTHDDWSLRSVIGNVVPGSAKIEGGKGIARVRLSNAPGDADTVIKIRDGNITNISVGYVIHKVEKTENGDGEPDDWRVVDWEPMEISAVPIPADPGAQIRSADRTEEFSCVFVSTRSKKEASMPQSTTVEAGVDPANTETRQPAAPVVMPEQRQQAPSATEVAETAARAERERVVTITDLARRANAAALGDEHIRAGTTVDAFRAMLLDHLVAQEGNAPTDSNVRVQVGTEEADRTRSAKIEALSYGLGAPMPQAGPSESARQFMGRGLVDLAADSIDYRGGRMLNARQIDEIFTRSSMSTSDFPIIFEGAINRALEQRYALAQPTFKRFARKRNFRDFRPDTTVKLGDFPLLQKVLENGEIKYGSFVEGKEQVRAFSYAIAMRVSRQMLINDDLGAIQELLTSYGASVALFEEVTFYASAFEGNLADGKAVYHADHKNLASAGTVIDVDNVGKARAAMSKQKSTGGNPLLSNSPKIILVGPDKLTEAEQLLASITPATMSNVNIFSGRLEPLETSQITGNAWYLLTDPAVGSNYRWGYLEGYEAPRVRMDEPFGQQGFAMSVEHDFGCGATDFRFGYKNSGKAGGE